MMKQMMIKETSVSERTNDLVKRLRNVQFWQADCEVRMQAADRIEELETQIKRMERYHETDHNQDSKE